MKISFEDGTCSYFDLCSSPQSYIPIAFWILNVKTDKYKKGEKFEAVFVTKNKINISMAEKNNRNASVSEAKVRVYWSLGREAVGSRRESISYRMSEAESAPSKAWT